MAKTSNPDFVHCDKCGRAYNVSIVAKFEGEDWCPSCFAEAGKTEDDRHAGALQGLKDERSGATLKFDLLEIDEEERHALALLKPDATDKEKNKITGDAAAKRAAAMDPVKRAAKEGQKSA